ncbi:MAG: ferrous iron transport protein A [Chloroflexota bacterium]|nr:ferrous iron transport protein A [Chloroflexota bacterium]
MLKDVAKGDLAQIVGFTPAVTAEQKSHLLAYGLVPGYSVRIIQQNPVTVVQVEHLELALEHNLSGEIQVKSTTS